MVMRFISKPFAFEKVKYCPKNQADDVKFNVEIHIPVYLDNKRILVIESVVPDHILPNRRIVINGNVVVCDTTYPVSCFGCKDTWCSQCDLKPGYIRPITSPYHSKHPSHYELIGG